MGFGRAGDGFRRWLYPSYGLLQLRVVAGVRQIPQQVVDALAAVDRIVVVEMQLRHVAQVHRAREPVRSEEHTSELQSLMRISYAVFCLNKKKTTDKIKSNDTYSI